MTLLGQGLQDIIKTEYDAPTGTLGDLINDYVEVETDEEIGSTYIDLFNNWEEESDVTGWEDFAKWIWYQIRRFIEWLFDLL